MPTPFTQSEEKLFDDLAAINYNLYLAGIVRRADTGEDWTFEQAVNEIKQFILSHDARRDDELRKNIGMLRQWLNEDRITDSNKLVTNEDIASWLFTSK
jgi:hypothetical protein